MMQELELELIISWEEILQQKKISECQRQISYINFLRHY